MLTTDRLKELEDKKKAAIAAFDAEIEQVKGLAKAHEEFTALVAKYKYESANAFLAALGLVKAETSKSLTPKRGANGVKTKGRLSDENKKLVAKLRGEEKAPEEIAKAIGYAPEYVRNYLKKNFPG